MYVPQAQWLIRYLSYHLQTERELNETRLVIISFSGSLIGLIMPAGWVSINFDESLNNIHHGLCTMQQLLNLPRADWLVLIVSRFIKFSAK